MTTDALLSVRVADMSAQIADIKNMMRRLGEIDDALYARVASRLEELIDGCAVALKDVENANANKIAWQKMRAAQKRIRIASGETLAFTQGALLRKCGVDSGFCALADKLLDHFNGAEKKLNWRGFTILDETAFFGSVGEVVRLRFPEIGIWNLPIAAHEFGHFANPTIRVEIREGSFTGSQYPVEEFLGAQWNRTKQKDWFHAHEFMADIFAVYALGAAYAYAVLFLRSDPGTLRASTTTHPSWHERYYLIHTALQRIVLHGGVTPQVVKDVERRWRSLQTINADNRRDDLDKLRKLEAFFYPLLDANLRGVRYATFGRAQQLVTPLQSGAPLRGATIPDILNAAWLARLHDLGDKREAARIGRNASKGCEEA